ncbi:thioesterase [Salipaludibacillus agaradhaerens]|jgi:medium-chain acyl-[acyl-carrier-protein] hydrolase|uniref:thioesterase II family protein n=1 Tax=Salipaludibacillus agaradhaerens TaxID=76935 RepID=UPI002151870D|nr:alpha/beta fold hydrolase [Salipaludibacillus agaradhaerens]MCR6105809.1 thioesterase [Salipaludibacillus agaradhaerens]MCR6117845.1 thioesterase [Salipaludibacillus agaradhaerens]
MNTAWLHFFKSINDKAKYRLYCFPCAGGGALSFQSWSNMFGSEIEVCAIQLPGRESRFNEDTITDIYEISRKIANEIIEIQKEGKPFVFLGHSMGSLISFEVARYLRKKEFQLPNQIFLSSINAPENNKFNRYIHKLSDGEFLNYIKILNGTPEGFFNDPRVQKLYLPILRSDFKAVEMYEFYSEEPFHFPITVLGGEEDKLISTEGLERWQRETNSTFTLKLFPGDHFYFQKESCQDLINYLKERLLN